MTVSKNAHEDHHSILVVNNAGKIRRLYTPFRVVCINEVPGIKPTQHVYVDVVMGNTRGDIIYLIYQKPYNYYHFHIVTKL